MFLRILPKVEAFHSHKLASKPLNMNLNKSIRKEDNLALGQLLLAKGRKSLWTTTFLKNGKALVRNR